MTNLKQYVGYSLDMSGSMRGVAEAAREDYNAKIASLKTNAIKYGVDTVVSVMLCSNKETKFGETKNTFLVQNSSIAAVRPLTSYATNGTDTQLFDSVNMLIDAFEKVPDAKAPGVGFLLDFVTDGGDNASRLDPYSSSSSRGAKLALRIKQLEATDKWTITFRVPNGYKKTLVDLGINPNNIMEFNAADAVAFQAASVVAQAATESLYRSKVAGVHATRTFYADAADLQAPVVKQELTNVSKRVKVVPVPQLYAGKQIRDFVEEKTGQYILGSVHYQLTKKEEIQEGKRFIVWDRETGNYYTGSEARSLLSLPATGKIRLQPGTASDRFSIFVQSNSVNRKLVGGTKVVILKD